MMLKRACAAAVLIGVLAGPAWAQQSAPPAPAPRVDANRLPVDINRISRKLQRATVREERGTGLNLRFTVEVYAPAPRMVLFPESSDTPNFFKAPAPYGAPTHAEVLSLITPREHGGGRMVPGAPSVDLGWLFRQFARGAQQ